jgi:hypothetical protein
MEKQRYACNKEPKEKNQNTKPKKEKEVLNPGRYMILVTTSSSTWGGEH